MYETKSKKVSYDRRGNLIYSYSTTKREIGVFILGSIVLGLGIILSLGILIGKVVIGSIGLILSILNAIGMWEHIREIKDHYNHFDVYENGIWVPIPTYWFWQKRPPKERYFRHFDDILDVKTEDMGWRSGVSFHINTKSEGEIFFILDRKPGLKFKEEMENAMDMYWRNRKIQD